MRTKLILILLLFYFYSPLFAQTLPGDSLVFGPMLSPVYHDSIRVWVMTKASSGSGNLYTLEVIPEHGGNPLSSVEYHSDNRSGYHLRSYLYTDLSPGQSYEVIMKKNGAIITERSTHFTNDIEDITDFEFLAGGCGRIFDMSRCIDQQESLTHINGTPEIYNHMATEGSDLMVWLGDAVYLLGLQHANGQCPGSIDDWATKDACFDRYYFYRTFHDSLCRAMPQLAITDNHDTGPNEFNKNMPTLPMTKELFMEWWPNPQYKTNTQGQGLYSSYVYKDVEFFLLDNRSYRESTVKHLGAEQLAWLKQALLNSTATFKVLVSGTAAFDKRGGGRNFSITTECDEVIQWIKSNNINGVLCYSADVHLQEFYGRYNDHTYPFFDIISGNLASDIGAGNTSITPDNDQIFFGVIQTYTRTNVYGEPGNRRFKIDYLSPEGVVYYGTIIHEDMLKSKDEETNKLSLSFSNTLKDSSDYNRLLIGDNILFESDRKNNTTSALHLNNSEIHIPYSSEIDLQDRTFSITYWIKPIAFPVQDYTAVFSNGKTNKGFTIGIDKTGSPLLIDHANNKKYTAFFKLKKEEWTHITWKYDNVKLQLMLYSNGQLVQKWSKVNSFQSSDAELILGNNFENKPFNGSLDEFNLYGKLISDALLIQLSEYTSHRGSALSLNGAQNTVIPSTELNGVFGNSFTLEFWARLTANPSTGDKLLACNGRVNNLTTGFALEFAASKKLNLVFGNNGSGWTSISETGNPWQVAEWNHVAITATKNDSLYLYINGIKTGSVKFTNYVANTFGLAFGNSTVYGGSLQAEIDEFRIWNASQVKDSIIKRMHYELDGNENNLAYYYDFNTENLHTVSSKGISSYAIALVNATLGISSAPVANISAPYRAATKGNWSIRKESSGGLRLHDPIAAFQSNVVIGNNPDTTTSTITSGSNIYYVKGGWQLDALNFPLGTLQLNLIQFLPKYDSISKVASEFYLFKETTETDLQLVNTGYFDGKSLRFMDTYLDAGIYHIGWKADVNAQLFNRKGALSLQGNHVAHIPYHQANAVLANKFTIEFWSRLMQDPNTNASLISNHGRVNGNSTGLSLEFPDDHSLNAVFGTNGSGWNAINTKKSFQLGEWNHIALTASPGEWIKLYLNGEAVDSNAYAGFVSNQINFSFGSSINYNNECIAMLDEFRIWNKEKTKKEIQADMYLSKSAVNPSLIYNYTFNHEDEGYLINSGSIEQQVNLTNASLIPSTAPIGELSITQQNHITGSWSVQDTSNAGLSILVSIPDYETNLVIGKNAQTGSFTSDLTGNRETLNTLWQIDPLKLAEGTFVFEGTILLGEQWDDIKNTAIEFYLMKMDENSELKVEAIGEKEEDEIVFHAIHLDYGTYTLGWKNNVTGLIDQESNMLHFYPNPSNDYLVLEGWNEKTTQLAIHDMTGLLIPADYNQYSESQIRVDTSQLAPGMYVIILSEKTTQEKKAVRFIKQ